MIDAVIIVPGTKQDLRYCIADYQIQCTQYRTKQDLYSCVPDDQIQLLNMEQNRISTTVFLVIKYSLFNMEQNKICTAVLLMIKFSVLNIEKKNKISTARVPDDQIHRTQHADAEFTHKSPSYKQPTAFEVIINVHHALHNTIVSVKIID